MSRRRAAALALAAAAWLSAAAAHEASERGSEVQAALALAEAALQRGEGLAALAQFQRAAEREHALDIELGIVRSHLQAGNYRRALAFASHVATAHADEPQGAIAYAELLQAGGQPALATRVLESTQHRAAATAALQAPGFAPVPSGAALPPQAGTSGVGVVIDGGRRVMVPTGAAPTAGRLWIQDGLGRTRTADVEPGSRSAALVVLRLGDPLPTDAALVLAPRDAFPGSPLVCLSIDGGDATRAALPVARTGFMAASDPQTGHLAAGACSGRGGIVLDLKGRLVGVAAPLHKGRLGLLPASVLERDAAPWLMRADAAGTQLPLDALYEAGLRWVVRVLTLPR